MVVDEWAEEAVDQLFHALADATRRDILRRSVRGEPSVSRLAEDYPMSFAAVQKNVAVLERAGLVTKERRGQARTARREDRADDRPQHRQGPRQPDPHPGRRLRRHDRAGVAALGRPAAAGALVGAAEPSGARPGARPTP